MNARFTSMGAPFETPHGEGETTAEANAYYQSVQEEYQDKFARAQQPKLPVVPIALGLVGVLFFMARKKRKR